MTPQCVGNIQKQCFGWFLSWFINILHMPESCAWNIAGGVARWKIYLLWKRLSSQLYSVAHTRNDSLFLGQMLWEQLSPLNGTFGQLEHLWCLYLKFMCACRVFICAWGGSWVTVSGGERIRMNLSLCLWPDRSCGGFHHSWLCFTCLNVPVLMVWYGVSQA